MLGDLVIKVINIMIVQEDISTKSIQSQDQGLYPLTQKASSAASKDQIQEAVEV